MKVLVVIPARGNSKGIPRKNLRSLAGHPLIYYSIQVATHSSYKPDVVVSSDDDEILHIAGKLCTLIHKRPESLAQDSSTLDPVIFDAYTSMTKKLNRKYDLIVTLQPTSPLLKTKSLDAAIKRMTDDKTIETIISAVNDTHLTWKKQDEKFVPNYEKRVNRQFLTPVYKETGSFLITRSSIISQFNRIGKNVELFELTNGEEIDIDTFEGWNLCEYYLRRKKIVIVVSGNSEIGLGHVYNVLCLANDILNHELIFITDKSSQLAFDKIASSNYKVLMQGHKHLADDIIRQSPDIVINDILDTTVEYVIKLKNTGATVINFEDLGNGANNADLVINAMYPEKEIIKNHYYGENYFCIKNEFLLTMPKELSKSVSRVLLTFGGVDPNNYTMKVLSAIYSFCMKNKIAIDVIAGMGYDKYDSIKQFSHINIFRNISNISEYMSKADLIFTSAGRTTFEVASIGVPCIVIAQNERELTHFFCKPENGFLHLGMGTKISEQKILDSFTKLVNDNKERKKMSKQMLQSDIKGGKDRVLQLIHQTINNHKK